jgi:hypothetical protein
MRPFLLILTLIAVLAGCGERTIDAFPIGELAGCSPPAGPGGPPLTETCLVFPEKAQAALDAREPGHAAITSMRMYVDLRPPDQNSGVVVFVFTLADGTTKATGVDCRSGTCVGIGSYPS